MASFYYYFSEERGISDRARGGEDVGGVCIDEPGNLDSDEVGGAARHAIVARVGAGGCKGDGGLTRWFGSESNEPEKARRSSRRTRGFLHGRSVNLELKLSSRV